MREEWIDRWKGSLIALVVLGHAVGVACHFAQGTTKEVFVYAFKIIYCFHMPAFFCVAGYVWRTRSEEGWIDFCGKKFRRLIVPYLVFSFLSGLLYYVMSGAFSAAVHGATDAYYAKMGGAPTVGGLLLSIVHAGGRPDNGVFCGNSVLWFLPAMFTVCVLYRFLDRWIRNVWGQLVLALCFLIGSFYVPGGMPWGLSAAIYYLSFVVVGRWILPKVMLSKLDRGWAIFVLGAIYLAICWITPNAYCRHQCLSWHIAFVALALFGCWVSALVARRMDVRLLVVWGLSSMGIMLMHKYIILAVGMKLPFVRALYASSLSVSIAMSGGVVALYTMGADVTVYDRHTEKLLNKKLEEYDVIVNAILWDKLRKDHIVYREDLKRMKRGALIIDISCDRAGAIETSVPTTIENPTYVVDGVVHYVVDHTPALFYKSTSEAISQVLPPYLDGLMRGVWCGNSEALIVKEGVVIDQNINKFQGRGLEEENFKKRGVV